MYLYICNTTLYYVVLSCYIIVDFIIIYIFFAAQMTEESVLHTWIHANTTAGTVQTDETPVRQEHQRGFLLIWHASLAKAHWPHDATHLGTMCASTRSFDSMPSKTAAVLVLKEGSQLKV